MHLCKRFDAETKGSIIAENFQSAKSQISRAARGVGYLIYDLVQDLWGYSKVQLSYTTYRAIELEGNNSFHMVK